jgi:hypothetical protein
MSTPISKLNLYGLAFFTESASTRFSLSGRVTQDATFFATRNRILLANSAEGPGAREVRLASPAGGFAGDNSLYLHMAQRI